MTKEEVRALALSKLRLEAHHVVWDVGAGTGSVSVECALSCPCRPGCTPVEKKEEALALLAENRARFHAANLEVVAGTAPEALEALPAPDRVFLGGTSGSLEDILNVIFRKNPPPGWCAPPSPWRRWGRPPVLCRAGGGRTWCRWPSPAPGPPGATT